MPSVNDPYHEEVESFVVGQFDQKGWRTVDLTYHNNMSTDSVDTISRNNSTTSWLVRCRSDRISFNEEAMVKWDAKTSAWEQGQDFAIETMPLFSMMMDEVLGADCWFFCRRNDGTEYAIKPSSVMDHITRILVPSKGKSASRVAQLFRWHRSLVDFLGIETAISSTDTPNGSGDPYAAIAIDDCSSLTFSKWFDQI